MCRKVSRKELETPAFGETHAKTWQSQGNLKKKATFTLGLKQVVRFFENDKEMAKIGDDNVDDFVSVSTYEGIRSSK